ncbi:molybdopterin converting factor subunit 1 [Magnetospira thiophila]
MKLLYFAWFREQIGTGEEDVTPPPEVATVGDLLAWLKSRGDGFGRALSDPKLVRVAVNQDYVGLDAPLHAGDEVALFPPVTGG